MSSLCEIDPKSVFMCEQYFELCKQMFSIDIIQMKISI